MNNRLVHYLPWVLLGLLLACTAAIYAVGVGGPWIFDDFVNLQSLYEDRAKGWSALIDEYLMSSSGRLGRPVAMLSFIFSAVTSGEYMAAWKWFNVGLHLLTGLAMFWLVWRLLEDLGCWQRRSAIYGGLLITALWLLHPLHVSTVLYTVQRMAILPVLFSALGLALYLSGRRRLSLAKSGWARILAALLLCWPLATFSKENGILLGAYVLLVEWLLLPLEDVQQRRRLYLLLGALIVLPGLLAVGYVAFNPGFLIGGYGIRDFTLVERLLTESRIVWGYVLWIFMPLQRFLGFMHDDIVVSTGWLEPISTLPAVLGWVVAAAAVLVLRRRQPLLAVGVGLFMASHLLESTVIPLELAFEHRNYFGSIGLLLAAVALLSMGVQRIALRRLLAALALLLFGLLLLSRVHTWGDLNRLYTSIWLSHPTSPRMVATVAAQYARNGQYDHGLAALDRLGNSRMDSVRLYILCLRDQELSDAELSSAFEQPPTLLTDYTLGALFDTARQALDGDCKFTPAQFVTLTERLLTDENANRNKRYKVLIYRAHFQQRAGDLEDALATLGAAEAAEPRSLIPQSLRTEWLIKSGRLDEARRSYSRLKAGLEKRADLDFNARIQELDAMFEAESGQ